MVDLTVILGVIKVVEPKVGFGLVYRLGGHVYGKRWPQVSWYLGAGTTTHTLLMDLDGLEQRSVQSAADSKLADIAMIMAGYISSRLSLVVKSCKKDEHPDAHIAVPVDLGSRGIIHNNSFLHFANYM